MTGQKYSFRLEWSDEDEVFVASCPEFPGLLAHGDTPSEAIKEAQIALDGVIAVYQDDGVALPAPQVRYEYSGQFRVRFPKTLHRQAAEIADQEGVSLNTFVVTAVAEKIGAMARSATIKPSLRLDSSSNMVSASSTSINVSNVFIGTVSLGPQPFGDEAMAATPNRAAAFTINGGKR